MAVGYGFISTLIVLCAFAFPSIWALTATELAAFKTTGDTEQNTKLKGTVRLTIHLIHFLVNNSVFILAAYWSIGVRHVAVHTM